MRSEGRRKLRSAALRSCLGIHGMIPVCNKAELDRAKSILERKATSSSQIPFLNLANRSPALSSSLRGEYSSLVRRWSSNTESKSSRPIGSLLYQEQADTSYVRTAEPPPCMDFIQSSANAGPLSQEAWHLRKPRFWYHQASILRSDGAVQ